jgi:hypothetical protein
MIQDKLSGSLNLGFKVIRNRLDPMNSEPNMDAGNKIV